MRDQFNLYSESELAAAEKTLRKYGVEFKRRRDGMLFVRGNLDLSVEQMTELPDLRCVIVEGSFRCGGNELTSLKGAPRIVRRDFSCSRNRLTSLEGAPEVVEGSFHCSGNALTSLEGAPRHVGGDFICVKNSLEKLAGAPHIVSGKFRCNENPLSSLEDAPQKFLILDSDFGIFRTWDDVPQAIRITLAREATVLQQPLALKQPLAFKKRR